MPPSQPVNPPIRAEYMQCALQDRVFSLGMAPADSHWRGILIQSGSGAVQHEQGELDLRAPCLAGIPWDAEAELRIKAGGVGFQFAIDPVVLANAIGHNPESADLRLLVDRRVLVPLDEAPDALNDAAHAFNLILRETRIPAPGSETMVEAQVRAVLVLLWRHAGQQPAGARSWGRSLRILQHFRQLLEVHFRDRWTVARYAGEIGISADRLHDICRKELDKPPNQLIQDRVIHEARLRLERSTQTVEHLAGALGFRDVGHFSRFFKTRMGIAPGAYRRRAGLASDDEAGLTAGDFYEWP